MAFENLQNIYPKSRVVYCSATGLSELKNLGYMSRLGIWGENSSYPDFSCFYRTFKNQKLDLLELLAITLRQNGQYVSRQLSYEGAVFEVVVDEVSEEMKKM